MGATLDRALTLATSNVPSFKGRTLVLVDTSASMTSGAVAARSSVSPVQAAALFGVTLAVRGSHVDLYGFADGVFEHPVPADGAVLAEMRRFCRRIGEVGNGTRIAKAVRSTYRGHDRVVILSDMQTMTRSIGRGVTSAAPEHVPMYGFNLQGYRYAAMPAGRGNRHEFGGFSDSMFALIPLLEAGGDAGWPF
ncbi:hypothetical protein ABZW11_06235 [Nonomuraea sp. NPDC004580]|uniref:hypothetical protein n=1 Tax=Nonomuraea sp. NPDC004580 TaxID=3154552 RepID=UPI0033BD9332